MSNALHSKQVASAASKAGYDLNGNRRRNGRHSSTDARKRFHKAMRRAVRRYIIESMSMGDAS